MSEVLEELSSRLRQAASELRAGSMQSADALIVIEECARLAGDASAEVERHVRASLEPLPDLPGQLPLRAVE